MSDLAAICVTFRVLLVSVCCMFVVHCAFVQSLGSDKMKKKVCNLPTVLKEKTAKSGKMSGKMSGGRENICLVSGSLRRILKFLRMTSLIARFFGW